MSRPTALLFAALAAVALFGLTIGLIRRQRHDQRNPVTEEGGGSAGLLNNGDYETKEGPWPSCVGRTANWCKDHIVTLDSGLEGHVFVLPEGSTVTTDWDEGRVRIYVDEEENVVAVPKRG